MRRIAVASSLAIVIVLLQAVAVLAHPLGNVSVNVYERIEINADGIGIRFVLDVAEFPALREKEFADTDDDGTVDENEATAYLDGFWEYLEPLLQLTANGEQLPLTRDSQALSFPAGQGGLQLLRAVYDLTAPQPATTAGETVEATLTETTFSGVQGWHEMIVVGGAGVTILESSVPDTDVTNELTLYPEEMLLTPLSVREATFTYRLDQPSASAPPATAPPATPVPPTDGPADGPRPTDPMVALLGNRLDAVSTLVGLLVATLLGAFHALTPGHGKTLVAAYLVGTRSNIGHGVWLGGTVAVTHTLGIFVLGIATLAFTTWFIPERIVSWLAVLTGILIVVLGAVFVWRAQQLRVELESATATPVEVTGKGRKGQRLHRHGIGPAHSHGHDHDEHSHDVEETSATPQLKRRDVAVLGIVGGLVPSGSALLLLLSAIALNELLYGLFLIVAFGIGMAAVLIGITVVIVFLRRTPMLNWERWRSPRLRAIAAWLPTISGLLVVALGLFLTLEALRNLR
jgi:ABC-type nickel/cobalt efflux system permease component RcnA